MNKTELNKKSLKELRGELFANRNLEYWQNDETKQKKNDNLEQSAGQDDGKFDEEDMGVGM